MSHSNASNMNVPGAFAKNFQCPCCKNPWNQAEGEVSIDNATNTAIACGPCLTDNKGFSGLDPANFDFSSSPGENFFLWSNGNWMKNNPIPNEYSSWNTFMVLRDLNLERLKKLLDDLSGSEGNETSEDFMKLKNCYQSFMNEEIIDSLGLSPLREGIQLCRNISQNPTKTLATLHSKYGLPLFFSLYSTPDKANSEWTIGSLYQSGLGLPDRDYYFDEDKKEKRLKYIEYITSLFDLYKETNQKQMNDESSSPQQHSSSFAFPNHSFSSNEIAKQIFEMEKEIASYHLTRTLSRDPNKTYNKLSFEEFNSLSKNSFPEISWEDYLTYGPSNYLSKENRFSWDQYFHEIGKSKELLNHEINLTSKDYLLKIPYLIHKYSSLLPFYSFFHLLNTYTNHLSNSFYLLSFQFYEKELKGTNEPLPRWKRALNILETILGELLGQYYVARHFSSKMKINIIQIVENIRSILTMRLSEITWMSNESKKEAFHKIQKFKIKIGYPDQWKDYSSLQIYENQHIQNVLSSKLFEFQIELNRMNAPTDKARWFMTPQTVNAYYHPSLNEIVFPAAILQPPFYDADADLAVQYGSLGAVVGHEMTHGFDDQGRKYDSAGNLRDWWTKDDGEEYERRANVMIKQAEKFEVYGLKLNGKLTCGENIADLGGMKLALKALKAHLATLPEAPPLINGLAPFQRFFLAWSQTWRENVKKERAMQLVTLDPHGPNELRCNGTVANIAEFYEAFGVTAADKMFIPEEERVDIW